MKKITALFAVLLASPLALACPTISGTFTCSDSSGETYTMQLNTTVENGVYVYESDGEKIYTDGQSRQFSNDSSRGQYTATCAGNFVDLQMNGEILENGQGVGTFAMTSRMTQNGVGFEQISQGHATYKGQTFPLNDTTTCRMN